MSAFRDLLEIPEPCDKFTGRDPKERSGFCHSCEREIINLSALTRAEATKLVESDVLHCAGYWLDAAGEVIFAEDEQAQRGAMRLMANSVWRNAAVLTLPMLLAACEPELGSPQEQATVVEPVVFEPVVKVQAEVGAARQVTLSKAAAESTPRLGEVTNKVERVEHRYNEQIEQVRPATLKGMLRDLDVYHGGRVNRLAYKKRAKHAGK